MTGRRGAPRTTESVSITTPQHPHRWQVILVESEGSEDKPLVVGNTNKTLEHDVSTNNTARAGSRNVRMKQSAEYPRHKRWCLV